MRLARGLEDLYHSIRSLASFEALCSPFERVVRPRSQALDRRHHQNLHQGLVGLGLRAIG